jgi:5'-nucleotidase
MLDKPLDLAKARVLISNDDGINAPGLKILERIMRGVAAEVWTVAPDTEQSGASHSLTLQHPLRYRRVSKRRYSVNGTPTDSVLLAVYKILKDNPPDLILSGINPGGNLGEDVTYSGTIAAAMEAALLGFPGIALSLVTNGLPAPRWATVEHWAPQVIGRIMSTPWPANVLINVNFPDVPAASVTGIEVVRQGRRKIGGDLVENVDPRGKSYFWIGAQREEDRFLPGTDLEAVNRGAITLTPLSLDLTHAATMKTLKAAFP